MTIRKVGDRQKKKPIPRLRRRALRVGIKKRKKPMATTLVALIKNYPEVGEIMGYRAFLKEWVFPYVNREFKVGKYRVSVAATHIENFVFDNAIEVTGIAVTFNVAGQHSQRFPTLRLGIKKRNWPAQIQVFADGLRVKGLKPTGGKK